MRWQRGLYSGSRRSPGTATTMRKRCAGSRSTCANTLGERKRPRRFTRSAASIRKRDAMGRRLARSHVSLGRTRRARLPARRCSEWAGATTVLESEPLLPDSSRISPREPRRNGRPLYTGVREPPEKRPATSNCSTSSPNPTMRRSPKSASAGARARRSPTAYPWQPPTRPRHPPATERAFISLGSASSRPSRSWASREPNSPPTRARPRDATSSSSLRGWRSTDTANP
jgi:hypothetical protein